MTRQVCVLTLKIRINNIKGNAVTTYVDESQSEFFFLEDVVYIQSANHIQVVNNKVTSNVNKRLKNLSPCCCLLQ